jgi:hypothetical protein
MSLMITSATAGTPEDEVRATFDPFVAAQNGHDLRAVQSLLLGSPDFLWITRGAAWMGDLQWSARTLLRNLLVSCGVFAFVTAPALADGSVTALGMGMGAPNAQRFAEFEAVIAKYNASGERFRIDGHCQSACTMLLAIRNVCVTRNATLLFHSGGNYRTLQRSDEYTNRMLAKYKPSLRKYVTENHFMDTFKFHSISGRVIISQFGYPACN